MSGALTWLTMLAAPGSKALHLVCGPKPPSAAECKYLMWRKRLRIESNSVKPERRQALQSANDNDATRDIVEFLGS